MEMRAYVLGEATSADSIEVSFPGGATATYPGPFNADQRLWLYQDQATPVASWGRPNRSRLDHRGERTSGRHRGEPRAADAHQHLHFAGRLHGE